jgi:hypothetical protein
MLVVMTAVNVVDAIRGRGRYVFGDDHHKTERSNRLQAIIDAPADRLAVSRRATTPARCNRTLDLRKCRLAA